MDKEKLCKSLKVIGIVSACVFVLILLIGIGFGIWMAKMSAGMKPDSFNLDGADLTAFLQLFGYMASVAFVVLGAIYGLFGTAVIWAGYGLVLLAILLWKKSRAAFAVIMAAVIAVPLVLIAGKLAVEYLPEAPGTVSAMAYDQKAPGECTIYIKENGEYVPYLVLDKNYQNTKNTLLLRKYIIGGTGGYVVDYNGEIGKTEIYDGQLPMNNGWNNYDLTKADDFLAEEFPLRFEPGLLNRINDTALEFCDSDFYENDEIIHRDMSLKRKFFLLSAKEIGYDVHSDDSVKTNGKPLLYFESHDKTGKNEAGIQIPWWTRSFGNGSYRAVGYENYLITSAGTSVKYGIRPAFTIPYDTKIRQVYEEGLGEIVVLDLE